MAERRILISLAHPDDESFGSGSLIAKYVNEGSDVYYICGTDGDRGTIPEEMQGQYDTVRELRLAELDCASEILGFKEVFKFHYKDSGMMNSETTKDPDCLWYHSQQPELFETLVERIVTVIREIQPQVILTFDPYGGYGHPDHIAMHHATVKAFDAAADPDYLPGTLPPYRAQKLYYTALPAGALRLMLFVTRLRGKDPRKMGTNEDIDFQAIVDHILPGHTRIDVRDYMEIGDRANICHASQGGGRSFGNFPG
ncbi:MAG: PIG-L family deacetylase, partial [Aggregatilineales bacterium]